MEQKVYSAWAYTENSDEKAQINQKIYKELRDKVKIGYRDSKIKGACRLLLDTLRAVPSDTETLRLRLNSPIMGITIESAALPPLCNASPDPEVFGDRVLDTLPTEKPDGDVLESMYLVMPTRMNK